MQEHTFEHFNREGLTGFADNVSITFFDKLNEQKISKKYKIIGYRL